MERFRVPMYVEVECPGVDERDAANRARAALCSLNLPGQILVAELRRGGADACRRG